MRCIPRPLWSPHFATRTGCVPTKMHVYPGYPHFFRRFPNSPGKEAWDKNPQEGLQWMMALCEIDDGG
ncbi:hypothetical protein HRG_012103 [Hirsutella rhossiliensis]